MKPFEHVPQRSIVLVAEDALRQPEIQHRIEPEKYGLVIRRRRIRAEVAVVDLVIGSRHLTEQEEPPLAQRIGVLADVRAEPRAGHRTHVLDRVDAEAIHVRLADPVAVSLDQRVDHGRPDRVVVVGIVLQRVDVAVLDLRIRVVVPDLPRR